MLIISKLMRVLDALLDKTSCEYQMWGERSTPLGTKADMLAYLMHLSGPCPI